MILTINLNSKEYPVEVIWKNIKKSTAQSVRFR